MSTQATQMTTIKPLDQDAKPDFNTQRQYAQEDVNLFENALKQSDKRHTQSENTKRADKSNKSEKKDDDAKTRKSENTHDEAKPTVLLFEKQFSEIQFVEKSSTENVKIDLSSTVNESRLLDSISKVADIIRVESARSASETLANRGQEIKINVKNDILPKTEIRLTDMGSNKFQVQINMNDVRAVQIVSAYRDDLQKQLGENYTLKFADLTSTTDTDQNPQHESATKQDAYNNEEEKA